MSSNLEPVDLLRVYGTAGFLVRGHIMPIHSHLEGQAFDPEVVEVMGIAFESACRELGLSGTNGPLAKIVARTVISAADNNCRDPALLTAKVLEQFHVPPGPQIPTNNAEERV